MVGEHAGVPTGRLQRLDHPGVQGRFRAWRHRAEYRRARDLVAERDTPAAAVEQPGGAERLRRSPSARPALRAVGAAHPLGRAGQQFQRSALVRGEGHRTGEHGVAHALRHRRVRLGEDLADEERVSRRPRVHVHGIERVPVDQLGHGRPAQGVSWSLLASGVPTRSPSTGAQRVRGAHGLPVGQHEQQRQPCRCDGPGTARGPGSPRRPSAGPRRPGRTTGTAARPARRRRSRAGRSPPGRTRRHLGPELVGRRHGAGRAAGACSVSRTCPTAPAPAPARRTRGSGRSCRSRPPLRGARPSRDPRPRGGRGRRARRGDGRAREAAQGGG